MEPSLINIIFSSVSSAGVFFSVFSVGTPDPDILKTLYTKIYGTLLMEPTAIRYNVLNLQEPIFPE